MAIVQPQPETLTREPNLSVYYKWAWTDVWKYGPYLQPLNFSNSGAPALGIATLVYRWGSGKWEDAFPLTDGIEMETVAYLYLQIRCRRGEIELPLWTGVVPAESFNLLGRSGSVHTADQVIEAVGLDYILNNRLDGAWVEPVGGGDAVWLGYLPAFNQRFEHGANIADAKWNSGKDSYIFAAEGEPWSNYWILDYLLKHYQAANGPAFNLKISDEIKYALNQMIDVYDFSQATLRQAINTLLSRSRGLSWTYTVDAEGNVELVPFSLLANAIMLGDIILPANSNQMPYDPWGDPTQMNVEVSQDTGPVYDKIIVRGAKIKSCCTVKFEDETLEKGWTDSEEDIFKAAAKDTAGYNDLTDEEKRELNDNFRDTDRFHRVFTTFRVPRNWNWKTGTTPERIVNPLLDAATGEIDKDNNAPYWNVDKRFANTLPLQVGTDYTGTIPINRNPSDSEPEFRRMFALLKDTDGKYQYAEKIEASVRPLVREMGVEVRFKPPYLLAKGHWDVEEDEPGIFTEDIEEFGRDYEDVLVTGFIITDQYLQVSYQFTRSHENIKTLIIDVPDAELWYLVKDTVIDVDENGDLIKYSGEELLRDDTARLRAILNAACVWYGFQHNKVTITSKVLETGIPIGVMLKGLDVTRVGASSSVVTSVKWDYQSVPATTVISTDFAELDIVAAAGGSPGTLNTPTLQMAARKIERTQKEIKEIKAQVDKTPLRIEPGGGGLATGSEIRRAILLEDAPYDIKIRANLCTPGGVEITEGEGANIDVYCWLFVRSEVMLDGCVPWLKQGMDIPVVKVKMIVDEVAVEKWYCLWPFNDSQSCVCD